MELVVHGTGFSLAHLKKKPHHRGEGWTIPGHFNRSHRGFQVIFSISTRQRSFYTSAHGLSLSDNATCAVEGPTFQLNISPHSLSASQNVLLVY